MNNANPLYEIVNILGLGQVSNKTSRKLGGIFGELGQKMHNAGRETSKRMARIKNLDRELLDLETKTVEANLRHPFLIRTGFLTKTGRDYRNLVKKSDKAWQNRAIEDDLLRAAKADAYASKASLNGETALYHKLDNKAKELRHRAEVYAKEWEPSKPDPLDSFRWLSQKNKKMYNFNYAK